MKEGNDGANGGLSEGAADVLREIESFERRLVAMPNGKDGNEREQSEHYSEEQADRRASRKILQNY